MCDIQCLCFSDFSEAIGPRYMLSRFNGPFAHDTERTYTWTGHTLGALIRTSS